MKEESLKINGYNSRKISVSGMGVLTLILIEHPDEGNVIEMYTADIQMENYGDFEERKNLVNEILSTFEFTN